eukprot:CAMPEP_0201512860 /NCGR_PEP_ID=MMETSP0161_2-20130828/5033_1 /ASSEMBLY_ACC=CAM_ASM_000251 /TAXON_ID=180227 /ORGANISM="Neoparamoeba aestuarina, Strain SoJaBio B1-5/56/2" /LENGTH=145 /DNA_ID=CAMNT_0047908863 /DNA_START=69 /DNA_END=506 /DNA_ORIENTATION=+
MLRIIIKVAGRVLLSGSGILTRAFAQAWQEAGKNAARQGTQAGKGGRIFERGKGMELEEAKKILGIEAVKAPSYESIMQKHNHLFDANDTAKGGSFYLQSKVVRAKERIDEAIETNELEGITGYPPPDQPQQPPPEPPKEQQPNP